MNERKYVKLRTDMYEDTKFKIIDMKPERDTIHYIWTRLLTLAARVNLGGDLFMSRNKKTGGAGIGLSIAKSIVDLHGGKIWVECEGDKVCFYVLIK